MAYSDDIPSTAHDWLGLDTKSLNDKSAMPSFKRGGKVKKTGPAKLHRGERVLTAKQNQSMRKRGR